jgi:3-methylfumaryl-CoA hydratase
LLLGLVRAELPGVELKSFDFRAVRPLIDGQPFQVQGCRNEKGLTLWVVGHEGAMTMQASAILKD